MKEQCATVLCVCKFVYVKVCVCVKELFGVTKLCAKDCVCDRDVCDKVVCERVVYERVVCVTKLFACKSCV